MAQTIVTRARNSRTRRTSHRNNSSSRRAYGASGNLARSVVDAIVEVGHAAENLQESWEHLKEAHRKSSPAVKPLMKTTRKVRGTVRRMTRKATSTASRVVKRANKKRSRRS